MAKQKSKNRKNLLTQITVIVVIIGFAGYFILSNFISNNSQSNQELDNTLNTKVAYTFEKQGELVFAKANDEAISKIDIEFADTPEKRELGLMFRTKMNENEGMLFLFDDEQPQAFWMKNTVLPLDIIYVNKSNQIVKIFKNTLPFSEASLPSIKPSIYVVEVNAGYTDRNKIQEGDKIFWQKN